MRILKQETIGRRTYKLVDRENGEWVVHITVAPKACQKSNPYFNKPRTYSWVYYHRDDATDCYADQIRADNRASMVLAF